MAMQQQGRLDNDSIEAFGGIGEIVRQADYLKQGGRASASGKLEKSLGMSIEMMRSLQGGDYDEYQKKAEEFYGKFNPEDWKTMAVNVGKAAFGTSEDVLGLGVDSTKEFRQTYLNNLSGRQGRGIGATASKLSDEAMAKMFTELVNNARGKLGKVTKEEEIEEEVPGLITFEGQKVPTRKIKKPIERDLNNEYEEALKKNDYDKIVEILKASDDPAMKQLANNFGRGMGSIMGSLVTSTETSSAPKPETKK